MVVALRLRGVAPGAGAGAGAGDGEDVPDFRHAALHLGGLKRTERVTDIESESHRLDEGEGLLADRCQIRRQYAKFLSVAGR